MLLWFAGMLVHNYRSHSRLLELPSRLYYDNSLVASADPVLVAAPVWDELQDPNTQEHLQEGVFPGAAEGAHPGVAEEAVDRDSNWQHHDAESAHRQEGVYPGVAEGAHPGVAEEAVDRDSNWQHHDAESAHPGVAEEAVDSDRDSDQQHRDAGVQQQHKGGPQGADDSRRGGVADGGQVADRGGVQQQVQGQYEDESGLEYVGGVEQRGEYGEEDEEGEYEEEEDGGSLDQLPVNTLFYGVRGQQVLAFAVALCLSL